MTYGKMKKRNRKPVRCINTGEIYESINAAAKELDLEVSTISKICRGIGKQTKGYYFEFAKEEEL